MKARVLSWDHREQPDLAELGRALTDLSGGGVHLAEVVTGDDQFAIVLSDAPVSGEQATAMYRRLDDEPPETDQREGDT